MIDRKVLSVFGLFVGAGVFFVANGMDFNLATVFGPQRDAGLSVAAGAAAGERADAMKLELFACGKRQPAERVHVPFEAANLGEFASFGDLPVEVGADHSFADISWKLDEGCYYVTAQPVDRFGEPIENCSTVRTPSTFLDPGQRQRFALVSSCDVPGEGAVEIAGQPNHPPRVADIRIERHGADNVCDTVEICATARDRDGDVMAMHWSVSAERGNALHLPAPQRTEGHGQLTECVEITPGKGKWRFEVTVRDQLEDGRRYITYEDAYLVNYGLVAHSRDTRTFPIEANCSQAKCPTEPQERITDVTYWITRNGRLLAPTDDLSRVREGDMVDVEFEVAPGCSGTKATFASYTGQDREEQASVFSRSYDEGSHMLWNVLPDCNFVADFHLGPPLEAAARTGENPYGDKLIDTVAGGRTACGEAEGD